MKLSVITVNLNNLAGLKKTMHSVLEQTFPHIEYIIIDGDSTDGSVDLIRTYERRIKHWISEPDRGIYHAMNKGIMKANGDYLLFLNSGDWLTDKTIIENVFDDEDEADLIYGDIHYVYPDGSSKINTPLLPEELTLANFNTSSRETIPHQAAFIKKDLFAQTMYDESYRIIADIKFFIEQIIFQNISVRYFPQVVTYYDASGLSSNPANWAETIAERERTFRELLPPRVLKDYELVYLIKDSPLRKYLPALNRTTGFHRFVAHITGLLVWLYGLLRSKKHAKN